ncbi:MAG: tetratricopeptide repeat protein [Beijerinckiaceae bacterium]
MPIASTRSGFLALLLAGAVAPAVAQQHPAPGGPAFERAQGRAPASGSQAQKPAEQAPDENVRKPVLDELFGRLAAARDEEEADGIAGAIERVFQRSGSDTADLLMNRAVRALHRKENKAAVEVLDKLVVIEPDWAEAWTQRATARFMDGDKDGAVEDLGQALAREPRHFNALAGLGSVLHSLGYEKRALEVFRRAIAIRPHQSEVKQMIDKLAPDVDGRDI